MRGDFSCLPLIIRLLGLAIAQSAENDLIAH